MVCIACAAQPDLSPAMQGQVYTDAGASAYDAVDGAINSIITTGLSSVNTMLV